MESEASCKAFLASAKMYLKNDTKYASVYVRQRMSRMEWNKLKDLRLQCSKLNNDAKTIFNGMKPCLIKPGHLMLTGGDGSLSYVKSQYIDFVQSSKEISCNISPSLSLISSSQLPSDPAQSRDVTLADRNELIRRNQKT